MILNFFFFCLQFLIPVGSSKSLETSVVFGSLTVYISVPHLAVLHIIFCTEPAVDNLNVNSGCCSGDGPAVFCCEQHTRRANRTQVLLQYMFFNGKNYSFQGSAGLAVVSDTFSTLFYNVHMLILWCLAILSCDNCLKMFNLWLECKVLVEFTYILYYSQ